MRILIIRHGDPDYEHDSLTEKGKREVNLLAQRLEKENITDIYCSPLGRARETAAPTCRRLGKEPVILDWLTEFPAPPMKMPYSGKEVCVWNMAPCFWSAYPEHFTSAWRHSEVFEGTGIAERSDYVCAEFDTLIAGYGYRRNGMIYRIADECREDRRTIAFFCHLGLGGCLLSHITGVPLPQWWHTMFLPTSSVTSVFMERHLPDRPEAIGRVVSLGDTSHLYAGNEPVSSSGLHNKMP